MCLFFCGHLFCSFFSTSFTVSCIIPIFLHFFLSVSLPVTPSSHVSVNRSLYTNLLLHLPQMLQASEERSYLFLLWALWLGGPHYLSCHSWVGGVVAVPWNLTRTFLFPAPRTLCAESHCNSSHSMPCTSQAER